MKLAVNVLDRDERLTIRELRDMVESRAFAAIGQKLADMIEVERTKCEKAETPVAWRKAQGALAALRAVKTLPKIIEQEMAMEAQKR
jgi:hypothetical protein